MAKRFIWGILEKTAGRRGAEQGAEGFVPPTGYRVFVYVKTIERGCNMSKLLLTVMALAMFGLAGCGSCDTPACKPKPAKVRQRCAPCQQTPVPACPTCRLVPIR